MYQVVGLVLFVSIGNLFLSNVVVEFYFVSFRDAGFVYCVWTGVVDFGGGLCMLRLQKVGFFF